GVLLLAESIGARRGGEGQRSGVRGQEAEVRSQRSEVRGQESEVRSRGWARGVGSGRHPARRRAPPSSPTAEDAPFFAAGSDPCVPTPMYSQTTRPRARSLTPYLPKKPRPPDL